MGWLVVLVRRVLWLLLLGAAGGAAYAWWRDRGDSNPPGPAEWPPLVPQRDTPRSPTTPSSTPRASASVNNSVVDAPEAPSGPGGGAWVEPDDDGSCPVTHPVKANDNSGIFHVPDGRFYARTRAARCYTTAAAAEADDYRRAKN